jgi:hypothetical protein
LYLLRKKKVKYNYTDGTIRHLKPYHPKLEGLEKNVINVIRDGRDVLVSCYYYYQKIGQLQTEFNSSSFQDYLYGRIKIEKPNGIISQHWTEQMFYDPINYWVAFVSDWLNFGSKYVFYEDLLQYKIPLLGKHYRKGIKSDYINHFTNKDNQYFWAKAGSLMKELGYRK